MTQDQIMALIDTFAEAETSFWFGLDEVGTKFDTDARRNRDDARAAVAAALEALTKDAGEAYQAGHNAGVAHHKKATEHKAKDAARYRAIRNGTTIYTVDREYETGVGPMIEAVLFEELDNAIDAAIAAQKGEQV